MEQEITLAINLDMYTRERADTPKQLVLRKDKLHNDLVEGVQRIVTRSNRLNNLFRKCSRL